MTSKPPGRIFYILGVALILLSFPLTVWCIVSSIHDIGGTGERFVFPGEYTMDLQEPGDYTVFLEYHTVLDNEVFIGPDSLPRFSCYVIHRGLSDTLPLYGDAGSYYSTAEYSASSIMRFIALKAGEYTMTCEYADGSAEPRFVLAVHHGFLNNLIGRVLQILLIWVLPVSVGVIVVIVTHNKRKRFDTGGPTSAVTSKSSVGV